MHMTRFFLFCLLLVVCRTYSSDNLDDSDSFSGESASRSAEIVFPGSIPLSKAFRTTKLPSATTINGTDLETAGEVIDPFPGHRSVPSCCNSFLAATCRFFTRCCGK